jgi:hypothetical protein
MLKRYPPFYPLAADDPVIMASLPAAKAKLHGMLARREPITETAKWLLLRSGRVDVNYPVISDAPRKR